MSLTDKDPLFLKHIIDHPDLWIKIKYQLADLSRSFGLVSHEIIHSYAKVYVTVGIKEAIIRKLPLEYQEVKPKFIPL